MMKFYILLAFSLYYVYGKRVLCDTSPFIKNDNTTYITCAMFRNSTEPTPTIAIITKSSVITTKLCRLQYSFEYMGPIILNTTCHHVICSISSYNTNFDKYCTIQRETTPYGYLFIIAINYPLIPNELSITVEPTHKPFKLTHTNVINIIPQYITTLTPAIKIYNRQNIIWAYPRTFISKYTHIESVFSNLKILLYNTQPNTTTRLRSYSAPSHLTYNTVQMTPTYAFFYYQSYIAILRAPIYIYYVHYKLPYIPEAFYVTGEYSAKISHSGYTQTTQTTYSYLISDTTYALNIPSTGP